MTYDKAPAPIPEPNSDIAKLLTVAEHCAGDLGTILDRFAIAATSAEPEVAAKATSEINLALAETLSAASVNMPRDLAEGVNIVGCWLRVARDQSQFAALIEGVVHVAASRSARFGDQPDRV